ncbi:MAG: DUF559 domain-containing protein [Elusimicrobiota bacterium]
MGDIKENARHLRKNLTDAERKMWRCLRHRQIGGHIFRRQAPIGRYIVDFVCFKKKLVIEVDGGQHLKKIKYDDNRTAWLNSRGYKVLRFWDSEALGNVEAVAETIYRNLVASSPSQPSPVKGEGDR